MSMVGTIQIFDSGGGNLDLTFAPHNESDIPAGGSFGKRPFSSQDDLEHFVRSGLRLELRPEQFKKLRAGKIICAEINDQNYRDYF